jgi:hypothetical protein
MPASAEHTGYAAEGVPFVIAFIDRPWDCELVHKVLSDFDFAGPRFHLHSCASWESSDFA